MVELSRLLPNRVTYLILSRHPGAQEHLSLHHESIRRVTWLDLSAIEEARPNYSKQVQQYIDEGHHGFAVVLDGSVVSLAWTIKNLGNTRKTVKGYYPLDPGSILFHGAWTHPEYRGRGLHLQLIHARLQHHSAEATGVAIETSIERNNLPSLKNYSKAGFTMSGYLTIYQWRRWTIRKIRSHEL